MCFSIAGFDLSQDPQEKKLESQSGIVSSDRHEIGEAQEELRRKAHQARRKERLLETRADGTTGTATAARR